LRKQKKQAQDLCCHFFIINSSQVPPWSSIGYQEQAQDLSYSRKRR
jgi:hypothetical protein